jgi:hypothetical protein
MTQKLFDLAIELGKYHQKVFDDRYMFDDGVVLPYCKILIDLT